jgi:hypothetical protein
VAIDGRRRGRGRENFGEVSNNLSSKLTRDIHSALHGTQRSQIIKYPVKVVVRALQTHVRVNKTNTIWNTAPRAQDSFKLA